MRVIELWTNTPMRFGKGGNVMTTHLVELPANEERAPQTWHHTPGKPPEQCISLTMEADAHGVIIVFEHADGSATRTLVREFASATVLESWRGSPPPMWPKDSVGIVEGSAKLSREDEPTRETQVPDPTRAPTASKGVPVPGKPRR